MAKILNGKEVSKSIIDKCAEKVSEKITNGQLAPKLSVIVIGQSEANNSYLKGINKKSSEAGVLFDIHQLDVDVSEDKVEKLICELNNNKKVNGILLMRPFPKDCMVDEHKVCQMIKAEKDVDAARDLSVAGVYLESNDYAPCTAESCMAILKYYNVDLAGKRAVVVGRSLVVGKPVANMLLNENASVTICHSKTQNIEKITKQADIVVLATGNPRKFDDKYFSKGQIVIDAGINWDGKLNKLCGDADFDTVKQKVSAITPVPGGVGAVTSAILIKHVVN